MFLQYAVLLFLLLVAQIVVGVLVFTNKREVQRVSERMLNNLWRDRQNHRGFWDTIQQGVSNIPFMTIRKQSVIGLFSVGFFLRFHSKWFYDFFIAFRILCVTQNRSNAFTFANLLLRFRFFLAQMLRFALGNRMDPKYTTILLWTKCYWMCCFGKCIWWWMRKITSRIDWFWIDSIWHHCHRRRWNWGKAKISQQQQNVPRLGNSQ